MEMEECWNQTRLKEVEVNLLKVFIEICEKLGLSYFAVQGTLLGTVRHRGFIPWDDDIDIGMLREDYELFLRKAPSLLPKYYFLQSFHTDPEYYHCFAKLRDSRTTFIENTAQKLKRMNQGIFIDIFPFDYYPENTLYAKWFELKKLLLRYRLRSQFYIPNDDNPGVANMLRRSLMSVTRVIYPSERDALVKSEELFMKVKPGNLLVNNGSPWGKREIVERAWMENTGTLMFEDITVCVPTGYDAYLRHVYGDYNILPPEEKRKPHHYARVIDPDTPYPQWMARLDQGE